jgi:hypothetical protein
MQAQSIEASDNSAALHFKRRRFGFRLIACAHLLLCLAAAIALLSLGASETGRYFAVAGMLVLLISQCVGFVLVLKESPVKAFLAFVIPGYALFVLGRSGHYPLVVGLYMLGVLSLVIGTVALS